MKGTQPTRASAHPVCCPAATVNPGSDGFIALPIFLQGVLSMYQLIRTRRRRSRLAGVGLALVAANPADLALEERLVILASSPEDLRDNFQ